MTIETEPRWRKALTRKRAEALDGVGEVDLVLGVELLELLGVAQHLRQRLARCPRGTARSVPAIGSRWPCSRISGYAGTFRCRSEPSAAMR